MPRGCLRGERAAVQEQRWILLQRPVPETGRPVRQNVGSRYVVAKALKLGLNCSDIYLRNS